MIGMKKISNIKMGKVTGNPATSAVVISNLNSVTVGVSVVRWHWNFIFRPLVFFLRCLPASFFVGLLLSFFVGLLLSFFVGLLLFFLRRLISPSPSLRIARCRRQRCLALSSSLLCCICCASLCGEFGLAALWSSNGRRLGILCPWEPRRTPGPRWLLWRPSETPWCSSPPSRKGKDGRRWCR